MDKAFKDFESLVLVSPNLSWWQSCGMGAFIWLITGVWIISVVVRFTDDALAGCTSLQRVERWVVSSRAL
jgi:hypothetical protein